MIDITKLNIGDTVWQCAYGEPVPHKVKSINFLPSKPVEYIATVEDPDGVMETVREWSAQWFHLTKTEAIRAAITQLENSIASLQKDVEAYRSDIKGYQRNIKNAESTIRDLEKGIDRSRRAIADHRKRLERA